MTTSLDVSRRGFLRGTATAGLTVGFHIPFAGPAAAQGATPEVNAWVVVKPDEIVVIRVARSEMGQGSLTGLAQLVAEELECDWSKVTTEYPTPGQNVARKRIWGDFSTGGSRGIRESNEYVRKGGAAARVVLVQAAASGWGVPAAECSVSQGVITHAASGRRTTYGAVAEAASKLVAPADLALKNPRDWTIAGKSLKRLDTADKLTGKQIFGTDVTLPGMMNAAIRDCPVFGGKVGKVDATDALKLRGVVKVVTVGDSAVAVIADTWFRAKTALDALKIEWDEGPNAQLSSAAIADTLKEGLSAEIAFVGNVNGDARKALTTATKTVEAVYGFPYLNHATMEPMNATAIWTPDKCQVWTPTQNGEAALAAAAAAAELPVAKCDVVKLHCGGGFGRRGAVHDWVRQAVLIAKQMPGTPVKLLWSREEDMLHGRYHPITQCKLTGGFDASGKLDALHMRISGQSILASLRPDALQSGKDPATFQGLNASGPEATLGYSVPHLLIEHAMRNPPVPPGFWRGVNLNQNAVYVECFMDELAHAANEDPLAFRRKLMDSHPKHLAVLNATAEKAGWGTPTAPGVFRGIAQTMGFGSYVAAVAEVSVDKDGKVTVHRIVAGTDPGYAVNPEQIARQVEGSFVYGLSAALYGECTVKNGRMEQENFDTYNVMRMDEMPKVETVLVASGGFWGGVGEPTIAVAAPAVLNAIFAATGKRIRSLPLKNHDLKA